MQDSTYRRRKTRKVRIGSIEIGGESPIVVQTMTNTPTLDTDATVRQIESCFRAGSPLVRVTAQGVAHARNLENIRKRLNDDGFNVALAADIHFNPDAAFEAAKHVEKVRINPGNFVDPGRVFKTIEYSDEEYAQELKKLEHKVSQFFELCRQYGTAVRIGVNHGSLSDRIMSRYGDTPEGMVESAMEFLRIAKKIGFNDIVISIKASNVLVMTSTVRLLVKAMEAEDMDFPLHLGVTEAGDGEDGRVKSAVGIGSLLADGIGDTIRVSLSEQPEAEIPVAHEILEHIKRIGRGKKYTEIYNNPTVSKETYPFPLVIGYDSDADTVSGLHVTAEYPSDWDLKRVTIAASIDLGRILLVNPSVTAVQIKAEAIPREALNALALSILQATRRRFSKTEFIACPGCGRTLFDLPQTLANVRNATGHLKGLKIGVMGCIVNGPGEMADADYGYVGGAVGRVSVYRGKECIKRNLSPDDALSELIELIKTDGRWSDPEEVNENGDTGN